MDDFPTELRYTQTHEWVREESDGSVIVGLNDYAQQQLGDIVSIALPDIGSEVDATDEICSIESSKIASEICSPISGVILEVNEELEDSPGLVNADPYGDGWIFRIEPYDTFEFDELLDVDAYQQLADPEEYDIR